MFRSLYKHCRPTDPHLKSSASPRAREGQRGQEAALWLGITALQVDHICPFGVFPPTLTMEETTSSCLNPCSAPHHLQDAQFHSLLYKARTGPSLAVQAGGAQRGFSPPADSITPHTPAVGPPVPPHEQRVQLRGAQRPRAQQHRHQPHLRYERLPAQTLAEQGSKDRRISAFQPTKRPTTGKRGSPSSLNILQPALGSLSSAGPAPLTGTELRAALRGVQHRPDATSAAAERGAAVMGAAVSTRAGAAPHRSARNARNARSARSDSPAQSAPPGNAQLAAQAALSPPCPPPTPTQPLYYF